MRPHTILPLLALLNMGANAATIRNFNSKNLGPYSTLPMGLQDSHNRRQVHNADFSSSTAVGPAAKGAITNTGSSSVSGSSRSPSTFDPAPATAGTPLSRRARIAQPFGRRVISVAVGSHSGAESMSLANGDATVQAREETGSDADIDVDAMKRESSPDAPVTVIATRDEKSTKGIAWRQVDDEDDIAASDPAESSLDSTALDAGDDDDLVTRDLVLLSGNDNPSNEFKTPNAAQVQAMLAQLDAICFGSRASSPAGRRMLSADTPVDVPMPGTAAAASGGARKHLARRGILDSAIGLLPAVGTTTVNCESVREILIAAGAANQDYSLVVFDSSPRIDVFPRNDNLDLPTLPVPAPSLPVRRDNGSASPRAKLSSDSRVSSARNLVRSGDLDLPTLPIPSVTPPIRRDTSVNGVSPPTVDSGGLSPRVSPFVWREFERL